MLKDQDEDMWSRDMDSPQTALVDKRRADWHTVRSRIHIIVLSITIDGVIVVIVVIIRTRWQTATGRQRRWIRDTQTDTEPGSTSGHSADASPAGNLQQAIPYFVPSTFLPFYRLVGRGPRVFVCFVVFFVSIYFSFPLFLCLLIISGNYQEVLNLKESQKPEPL